MTEQNKTITPKTSATAIKKTAATVVGKAVKAFVGQGNSPYDFGKNITFPALENLIHDNLFPKIKETQMVDVNLQNKFAPFAQLVNPNGELIEEFVVADNTPVELGLDKAEEKILKRKYPELISTLYTNQIAKKSKITIDTKEVRKRVSSSTTGMIEYYSKLLDSVYNGVRNSEQLEWFEAFVAYYRQYNLDYQQAATADELPNVIATTLMNLQDNSTEYNQASTAGLTLTTSSNLEDLYIITTNEIKARLLTSFLPQNFNNDGIDFTDRIISINKFPTVNTLTADYTLTATDVQNLAKINYMLDAGDVIKAGAVIPQTWVDAGFGGQVDAYTFDNKDFGFIIDRRAIKYLIDNGAGWTEPFKNGEYLQANHWFHYTSLKAISPFFNKATFGIGAPPTK